MFGFHLRVRYIDAVQDAVPGALLPPRELLQPPARRRYTLVREVETPHENAFPFYNIAPTAEDWEVSANIWRCRACEHQWFNVTGLETCFDGIKCPHCNIVLKRFDRPSGLPPLTRYSVKAPPAVATPSAFVPVVGPDESSLPAASIASDCKTLSGPPKYQPPASALNACKLSPG